MVIRLCRVSGYPGIRVPGSKLSMGWFCLAVCMCILFWFRRYIIGHIVHRGCIDFYGDQWCQWDDVTSDVTSKLKQDVHAYHWAEKCGRATKVTSSIDLHHILYWQNGCFLIEFQGWEISDLSEIRPYDFENPTLNFSSDFPPWRLGWFIPCCWVYTHVLYIHSTLCTRKHMV